MEKIRPKYYITTAIAYTSGKPHIGNTYEVVLADSIARFKRQQGYDVFFQTGTDEHGQKIELKAEEAGITPKEFVDNVSTEIKRIWDLMNTSYDKFIRTTDADHEAQVQKIFKKLYDQGDIYKGYYEGLYCTPCESFFTESQLVDGKCPDCGRPVTPAKEEAYFFKMSKYAPRLIDYINTHPEFIQPVSRKNEMMNNFLLPGLQDLCVSRTSFTWGIPVSFDPKHVTYVWLDALTNYITGIGYDCDGNSSEQFNKLWPADLHLIGKDIIRFHTIYWPIFLMALDLPLPKQVFGHPWLLQGDGKMSKSKGNVVDPYVLAERFGCPVVGNFRVRDVAAGGLGAPLVPYTEFLLYRSETEHTALQNIGGIGNITLLPAGCALSDVTAFDTGPGNMLIDAAIARITNGEKRYDANGAMAASGRVSEALLAQLMRDPYLSRRPPKTTGREHYGAAFVDGIFAAANERKLSDADILATVTDFTAQTIAAAIRDFCAVRPARLIVGGGGSRNGTLMADIAAALPDVRVLTNEDLGFDGDAKEAVAFAVLANEAIFARCSNAPGATGARHGAVLGKITL